MAIAKNLHHQYEDLDQQNESYTQGMWIFLATEILFFGGLFTGYIVYRHIHVESFHAGSHELHYWLGTLNTAVLLISSLTMALAVRAIHLGRHRLCTMFLAMTIMLGLAFLAIKGVEYHKEYLEQRVPGLAWRTRPDEPPFVELFYSFYFVMTGLHAIHMAIGVCVAMAMAWVVRMGRFGPDHYEPVEMLGLYWHFVDIIWIFLLPLLYLMGRTYHP